MCNTQCFRLPDGLCRRGSRLFRLSLLFCSACYMPSFESNHHNLVIAFFSFHLTIHDYIVQVLLLGVFSIIYIDLLRMNEKNFGNWKQQEKKKAVAMLHPAKHWIKTRNAYLSLISFEDCHSPWMLHIETAMSVPALPVFIQACAA